MFTPDGRRDGRVFGDGQIIGTCVTSLTALAGNTAQPGAAHRTIEHGYRRKRTHMKTYDIEIQRLKSARHFKGLIELGVDVLVQPRSARDGDGVTSCLSLPVDDARTLLILLKQQLAELDKLQPRSRRSGRC